MRNFPSLINTSFDLKEEKTACAERMEISDKKRVP